MQKVWFSFMYKGPDLDPQIFNNKTCNILTYEQARDVNGTAKALMHVEKKIRSAPIVRCIQQRNSCLPKSSEIILQADSLSGKAVIGFSWEDPAVLSELVDLIQQQKQLKDQGQPSTYTIWTKPTLQDTQAQELARFTEDVRVQEEVQAEDPDAFGGSVGPIQMKKSVNTLPLKKRKRVVSDDSDEEESGTQIEKMELEKAARTLCGIQASNNVKVLQENVDVLVGKCYNLQKDYDDLWDKFEDAKKKADKITLLNQQISDNKSRIVKLSNMVDARDDDIKELKQRLQRQNTTIKDLQQQQKDQQKIANDQIIVANDLAQRLSAKTEAFDAANKVVNEHNIEIFALKKQINEKDAAIARLKGMVEKIGTVDELKKTIGIQSCKIKEVEALNEFARSNLDHLMRVVMEKDASLRQRDAALKQAQVMLEKMQALVNELRTIDVREMVVDDRLNALKEDLAAKESIIKSMKAPLISAKELFKLKSQIVVLTHLKEDLVSCVEALQAECSVLRGEVEVKENIISRVMQD